MPTQSGGALAIIAGGGSVPVHVARSAAAAGRPVLVIGIGGEVDGPIAEFPHAVLKWGEIGRLQSMLAAHKTEEIVLIGNIRSRPDFSNVKLDFGAVRVLPEVLKILASGDNDVLTGVIRIFAKWGYKVVGAHDVAHDLVAETGTIAGSGAEGHQKDIAKALDAARAIGLLDAGQAAVAVNGRIVALEAAEGTDAMLGRVRALKEAGRVKWKGRAGILAKSAKPQQDLRVDMPTIGPPTVQAVADIGLAGIAIEAGRVMIVDREEVVRRAEAAGIFIVAGAVPKEVL